MASVCIDMLPSCRVVGNKYVRALPNGSKCITTKANIQVQSIIFNRSRGHHLTRNKLLGKRVTLVIGQLLL